MNNNNFCILSDKFQRVTDKNNVGNTNVLTISAQHGLINQFEYYNHQYASENTSGYTLLHKGDFAYNKSYSDGYPWGATKRLERYDSGVVSPLYICFAAKDGVCADFYSYYFESEPFYREIYKIAQEGARNHGLLNVATEDFFKIRIANPPQEEQRRIADILGCCDRVIALKKELIAEKKKQKKALMQKLLNPDSGFRLPGFSGEWETYFLRDLYDFKKSTSIPRSQLGNSGIAYLHYGDIHKSTKYHIDVLKELNDLPKLSTTDDYSKYMLLNGDVVFVDASEDYDGVSKYTVIKNPTSIPFIAGLHTIVARSKNNLLSIDFQQFCFQNECVKQQFFFYASGMKVFGLNAGNLGKIQISIPSTDEQQAIADILSATDKEIDLLEQELAQQEQKKKSLMQLLLTGIVRV